MRLSIILARVGGNKINVIKAVRDVTGLGLNEAKHLVDSAPALIKKGVSESEADAITRRFAGGGATVEIRNP